MTASPSPEDTSAVPGPDELVLGADDLPGLHRALEQRVRAVEAFLADVYGPRRAVAQGVISHALVTAAPGFSREAGQVPPPRRWAPLTAFDLARGPGGRWMVAGSHVGTLDAWALTSEARGGGGADGTGHVAAAASACGPPDVGAPLVAVLLPSAAASPWRAFAQRHGILAVRHDDLLVSRGQLLVATTRGLVPVHVLLRPPGDDLLDPVVSSHPGAVTTGCPGLLTAVRSGAVTLVGALGAALADDASVRARFGDLVRFHLGEEPELGDAPLAPAGTRTVRALVAVTGDETVVTLHDSSRDPSRGGTPTAGDGWPVVLGGGAAGRAAAVTDAWHRRLDASGSRLSGADRSARPAAGSGLDLREPPDPSRVRTGCGAVLAGQPC